MTAKATLAAAAATGVLLSGAIGAQQQSNDSNTFDESIDYEQYLGGSDLRASELLGATVRSAEGEEIGEIEDLIVSRDDDVITAVIAFGGILNIGEKQVGVPYEELRVTESGDAFYLAATREELEAQPSFEYEPRPGDADQAGERDAAARADRAQADGRQAAQTTDDDAQPSPAGQSAVADRREDRAARGQDAEARRAQAETAAAEAQRNAAEERNAEERDVETLDPGAHRASNLIGTAVVDASGEEVGQVDDLVVSSEGRIEAVLSIGGIIGIGDRLIAVPFDELEITSAGQAGDEEEMQVRIDMSVSELVESTAEFQYDLRAAR